MEGTASVGRQLGSLAVEQWEIYFCMFGDGGVWVQGPRPDVSYTAASQAATAVQHAMRNSRRHVQLAGTGTISFCKNIPTNAHGDILAKSGG